MKPVNIYEEYVKGREEIDVQLRIFEEESELLRSQNIEKPKFSWRKLCLLCPCCNNILKVKRKSDNKIIKYSHLHVVGNNDQIFYCDCGYRYAQRYNWVV